MSSRELSKQKTKQKKEWCNMNMHPKHHFIQIHHYAARKVSSRNKNNKREK